MAIAERCLSFSGPVHVLGLKSVIASYQARSKEAEGGQQHATEGSTAALLLPLY